MIYLMVYSVNHGQFNTRGSVFGNFKYDSPKIGNFVFSRELFCLHSTNQHGRHVFYMLPFLYSSEIDLFMSFFYNALVQFLKRECKAPMAAVI